MSGAACRRWGAFGSNINDKAGVTVRATIKEANIASIENAAKSVKGVATHVFVPKLGNITPTLDISWDTSRLTINDFVDKLRNGNPSIEVMPNDKSIHITVWVMRPGQEKIVARRVKEVLAAALA